MTSDELLAEIVRKALSGLLAAKSGGPSMSACGHASELVCLTCMRKQSDDRVTMLSKDWVSAYNVLHSEKLALTNECDSLRKLLQTIVAPGATISGGNRVSHCEACLTDTGCVAPALKLICSCTCNLCTTAMKQEYKQEYK